MRQFFGTFHRCFNIYMMKQICAKVLLINRWATQKANWTKLGFYVFNEIGEVLAVLTLKLISFVRSVSSVWASNILSYTCTHLNFYWSQNCAHRNVETCYNNFASKLRLTASGVLFMCVAAAAAAAAELILCYLECVKLWNCKLTLFVFFSV